MPGWREFRLRDGARLARRLFDCLSASVCARGAAICRCHFVETREPAASRRCWAPVAAPPPLEPLGSYRSHMINGRRNVMLRRASGDARFIGFTNERPDLSGAAVDWRATRSIAPRAGLHYRGVEQGGYAAISCRRRWRCVDARCDSMAIAGRAPPLETSCRDSGVCAHYRARRFFAMLLNA